MVAVAEATASALVRVRVPVAPALVAVSSVTVTVAAPAPLPATSARSSTPLGALNDVAPAAAPTHTTTRFSPLVVTDGASCVVDSVLFACCADASTGATVCAPL